MLSKPRRDGRRWPSISSPSTATATWYNGKSEWKEVGYPEAWLQRVIRERPEQFSIPTEKPSEEKMSAACVKRATKSPVRFTHTYLPRKFLSAILLMVSRCGPPESGGLNGHARLWRPARARTSPACCRSTMPCGQRGWCCLFTVAVSGEEFDRMIAAVPKGFGRIDGRGVDRYLRGLYLGGLRWRSPCPVMG